MKTKLQNFCKLASVVFTNIFFDVVWFCVRWALTTLGCGLLVVLALLALHAVAQYPILGVFLLITALLAKLIQD